MASVNIWRMEYKDERPEALSANDRMQLIIGAVFFAVLTILLGIVMLYIYKKNKK